MGYSVYYTGEITISPELDADRATLLVLLGHKNNILL